MDPGYFTITGDSGDFGKFKIPSLRNIAVTAPYMHDGRFNTLEEVVDFYSEGIHMSQFSDPKLGRPQQLTPEEKEAVLAFLHTLTDSTLLNNPAWINPY